MEEPFKPPSWAGKPPSGLHLDVNKNDKMIQKYMIDEKSYYLFGRNTKICDISIDHASCSRVHAAFIWHHHLQKAFLIDLGTVHGTYVGGLRLEPQKPLQIPINSTIRFGASTRVYILRERPQKSAYHDLGFEEDYKNLSGSRLVNLPEDETELENLTEFNTAHNRRITSLGLEDGLDTKNNSLSQKLYSNANTMSVLNPLIEHANNLAGNFIKDAVSVGGVPKHLVRFSDREEVINPEDVDPTIGKYRNMVQTIVLPKASSHSANPLALQQSTALHPKTMYQSSTNPLESNGKNGLPQNLYDNDEDIIGLNHSLSLTNNALYPRNSISHKPPPTSNNINQNAPIMLSRIPVPNPAPDIDEGALTSYLTTPRDKNVPMMGLQTKTHKRKLAETMPTTLEENSSFAMMDHNVSGGQNVNYMGVSSDETHPLSGAGAGHKKKKYAKEAWPGKKPGTTALHLPINTLI